MPYDLDLKKRSLYAPDNLWNEFRKRCDKKKCQVNATLLVLIEAVANGKIKLQTPKRPGLKFALDEEILELAEPDRFRPWVKQLQSDNSEESGA